MMRDIDDFLPQVLIYAPNSNDLVAYRFLVEAARDLCDRLQNWRQTEDVDLGTVEDCEAIRDIVDADIISIETASIDGAELDPKTTDWLDENYPGWEDDTEPANPARFITQTEPNTIRVYPRQAGTLRMRLVLKPKIGAHALPDFLYHHHGTELGRAAAGRLLIIPDASGATPGAALGTMLIGEARDKIDDLTVRAAKGQQKARLRTKGQYF